MIAFELFGDLAPILLVIVDPEIAHEINVGVDPFATIAIVVVHFDATVG